MAYEKSDHSFNNRIYLLYLIIFFGIWVFITLTFFAGGGALLLDMISPGRITSYNVCYTKLLRIWNRNYTLVCFRPIVLSATILSPGNLQTLNVITSYSIHYTKLYEEPFWGYRGMVQKRMKGIDSMLDMGTGGGEFLASLKDLPAKTYATESYVPNILIATARLEPLGVKVVPLKA